MTIPTYPKNNIGRDLIPLQIGNQTNQNNLYLLLTGTTDPTKPDHNTYYLSDFNGNVALFTENLNRQSYSLQLQPGKQTIQLPRLSGLRLYFSFDQPLLLTVPERGVPDSPAGWLPDSNYQILYDWVELTWEINDIDMTIGANPTQVDLFGIPFEVELTGFDANGQSQTLQGGFKTGGLRNQILGDLKQSPSPWNQLVIVNSTTGDSLRAICPYHGMEMNLFPKDQLDDYINQVWNKYETETLTVSAENVMFNGQVTQGNFVFTPTISGVETITFPKPSTYTVYTSGPMPAKFTPKGGVIGAALQAGFMRSTLLLNTDLLACDSSQYYQDNPVNEYARIIHHYAIDGGAYTFGFDDVCSGSSVIIIHNPQSAQITLLPFSK